MAQFTCNCLIYRLAKPTTHGPRRVLRPLPIPQCPWEEISIDFVSGLLNSNGYYWILVVVDCLLRMRHLVRCQTFVDAEQTTSQYLHDVWKLHGLPNYITSDRGTQFTGKFWSALCKQLKNEARISTAYHPETDSQTELLNAVMEKYPQCYVSNEQEDWRDWLPMAQFEANNQVSAATNTTPFFANYGYQPRLNYQQLTHATTHQTKDAQKFAKTMLDLQQYLRTQLKVAQEKYQTSTNKHRTRAPAYQFGNKVLLSGKNICTTRTV